MATRIATGDNETHLRGARWWKEVGWKHIFAIAVIIFAVFPLLYVLSASFNPTGTLTGSTSLFSAFTMDHYIRLFGTDFPKWMLNSFIVSTTTAIGTVVMAAAAAYAFSRFRFKGRRGGLTALLIIQMFPQMLAFIAIFLLALTLGEIFPFLGIGSRLQLIMIYLGGALGVNTFLMYGFFNTIPKEIDEAARIDGAGHARIFFTIILRLVAPILSVVGLLSFIGIVNEYVIASVILIDPEKQTLVVGLTKLVANPRYADWSAFSAGAVMAAIPVMILFLCLQKYIVGGLTAGAVK